MPSRRGSLTGPKRTSVDGPRKNSGLNGSRLSMTRAQSWEDRNVVGLGEVDGDDDVGNGMYRVVVCYLLLSLRCC